MREQFISEEIKPLIGAFDLAHAAPGEPALPRRFRWRGEVLEVTEVLHKEKSTGPCTHGSGERYVRRHWFDIRTADGRQMRIYFDRKATSPRTPKTRWWLYSIQRETTDDTAPRAPAKRAASPSENRP